jgi:quinol monooxygenase YgiN
MIVVTGRMHIAPESRERFAAIATEMCSRSREDAGCSGYRVYADLEQADRYVIVEEWADDDALQQHFTQPHTGTSPAFLSVARPGGRKF